MRTRSISATEWEYWSRGPLNRVTAKATVVQKNINNGGEKNLLLSALNLCLSCCMFAHAALSISLILCVDVVDVVE